MTGKGGQALEVTPLEDAEGAPPAARWGRWTEDSRARKGISEFEFFFFF